MRRAWRPSRPSAPPWSTWPSASSSASVVGAGAGLLLGWSREHGLSSRHTRPLAVLVLPLIAYFGAELAGGNAFVAAFVAGTAFAGTARWLEDEESSLGLTEALADPLGFAVWFAFGFIAVPLLVEHVGWTEVVFAVLALTLLRMAPVALALLGTGLRPRPSPSSAGSGPAGWPRWSSPCSPPRGSTSTTDLIRVDRDDLPHRAAQRARARAQRRPALPALRRLGRAHPPDPGAARGDRAAQPPLAAPPRRDRRPGGAGPPAA